MLVMDALMSITQRQRLFWERLYSPFHDYFPVFLIRLLMAVSCILLRWLWRSLLDFVFLACPFFERANGSFLGAFFSLHFAVRCAGILILVVPFGNEGTIIEG